MIDTINQAQTLSPLKLTPFQEIKEAFQKNFDNLTPGKEWFLVDVNKDELWDTYLNSFPQELRQQHTCNSCCQFIKSYGGLVTINQDLTLTSIWDFDVPSPFKEVVNNLKALVESKPIENVFRTHNKQLGTDFNLQTLESGTVIRWHHWSLTTPYQVKVNRNVSISTQLSLFRDNVRVLKRSLEQLTVESTETVLELIAQNSIYRGREFEWVLKAFLKYQKEYKNLSNAEQKTNYCWSKYRENSVCRIRNGAIGTLLINLSEGVDPVTAVNKFETVMAPSNYKRPKPVVTPKMLDTAKKTVIELGLEDSLGRRFATESDLTINDVLFVDRTTNLRGSQDIFEQVKNTIPVPPKKFNRVEEISLDDFTTKVIPTTTSLEFLLENGHEGNLVSLIAPSNMDAPSLFKWDNGFSWSYNKAIADSLSARVQKAGGKVEGELRCSLEWYNYDDLDIYLVCPDGEKIYFQHKRGKTGGQLDVDMNAGSGSTREAVENIIFPSKNRMDEGTYTLLVNNYCLRENKNVGFRTEIECQDKILSFEYPQAVRDGETIKVAKFEYSKRDGITVKESIPSTAISKQLWGMNTNIFHKVKMALHSPNYWENSSHIGNKHFFFTLEGAKNEGPVRGFFNEFLKPELLPHKHAFEVLGGAIKIEDDPNQLSGVGFSSTSKGSFTVKVTGNTTRVLKVNTL